MLWIFCLPVFNAEFSNSFQVVVLWNTFAQQTHGGA
jgi:hypothetical protein